MGLAELNFEENCVARCMRFRVDDWVGVYYGTVRYVGKPETFLLSLVDHAGTNLVIAV